MNTELNNRWTLLSKAKQTLLDELNSWPENRMQETPAQGWSASQVLEHILTSETGTLGYMKKKSSSGWETLELTGEEHKERSNALNSRLASSLKIQAPSVLPEPTNQYTLIQLSSTWNKLRDEMESFIVSVDPTHYDKLVFRQPIVGMLNLLQTLEFLENHIHHHIPQLDRIRQELRF